MFPVLFLSIVLFIALAVFRKKNTEAQEEVERQFWEKENEANQTRRQDISELDYITIPLEHFPLGLDTEAEQTFVALAQEKIINFEGLSNTELKLRYGVANLEALTEYENNYVKLEQTIEAYARDLIEAERYEDALMVLEYGVSIGSTLSTIYLNLANIYYYMEEKESIPPLISRVENFKTLTKDSLIKKLQLIYEGKDPSDPEAEQEDEEAEEVSSNSQSSYDDDDDEDQYAFLRKAREKNEDENA